MAPIDDVAASVAKLLMDRKETVAVAESAAGGLISAALLRVAGASAYFRGGVVVYTGDGKQRLAGMSPEQIAQHRSSTEPHTIQLAETIRAKMDTTWAVAETGAAGPTGNRYGDAAGHAALAVAGPGVAVTSTLETGSGDRAANMDAFAVGALNLLLASLNGRR